MTTPTFRSARQAPTIGAAETATNVAEKAQLWPRVLRIGCFDTLNWKYEFRKGAQREFLTTGDSEIVKRKAKQALGLDIECKPIVLRDYMPAVLFTS